MFGLGVVGSARVLLFHFAGLISSVCSSGAFGLSLISAKVLFLRPLVLVCFVRDWFSI